MGWGKFFGDIAKDLAKDYVTNRGADGIREDIGSVASGVKSLFGSSDNDSDDFWDTYNSLIENDDYKSARKLVNEYFEDDKKSYIYHYLLAQIDYNRAQNENFDSALRILEEAKRSINKAYNSCPIGTEDQKSVKELRQQIEEDIAFNEEGKAMMADWDRLLDKKDKVLDSNVSISELNELATEFLNHNKRFTNGKLDYFYWINLCDIHYYAHAIATTQEENDHYYKVFQQDLDNAMSMAENEADRVSDITAKRAWKKFVIREDSPQTATPVTVSSQAENTPNQSEKEKEYLAEIKMCLEDDGMISDRERRILNRLRQSLGISEERAAELEASLDPSALTATEQEYADEIRACLEDDGEISAKERRLLDKFRNSLGISPERAAEIEDIVIAK